MRALSILISHLFILCLCPAALAAVVQQNLLPPHALQSSVVPTGEFDATGIMEPATPLHRRTHMLVLKCPSSEGYVRSSRVSVLDMSGEPRAALDRDIALVSGHGLISVDGGLAKGCFVQDFAGRKTAVSALRLAPNYRAGTAADWGLIQFQTMKTPGLIRYPLRAANVSGLETKAAQGVNSRFASARGRPENGQNCSILHRQYAGLKGADYDGVLAHNCRATAGQSGAPISTPQDELLGIHLGTSWTVRCPFTGRPASYGYLRELDADMVKAIRKAAAQLPNSKT